MPDNNVNRTPTAIDAIAEAWLDTYLEHVPEERVYLGRAGREADYADYSPAGADALNDATKVALESAAIPPGTPAGAKK